MISTPSFFHTPTQEYVVPKSMPTAVFFAMMKAVLCLALLAAASAVELTPDNWDEQTAGKTVFIKFLAPW